MKKIFIVLLAAAALFARPSWAQEAVLHADGSQELRLSDASGKTVSVTIPKGEAVTAKSVEELQRKMKALSPSAEPGSGWISHEAVMLKDGSQEIHMTDPSGKERIISAKKGESVQARYRDFLAKEGIPCGCSNPAAGSTEVAKTATLQSGPQK